MPPAGCGGAAAACGGCAPKPVRFFAPAWYDLRHGRQAGGERRVVRQGRCRGGIQCIHQCPRPASNLRWPPSRERVRHGAGSLRDWRPDGRSPCHGDARRTRLGLPERGCPGLWLFGADRAAPSETIRVRRAGRAGTGERISERPPAPAGLAPANRRTMEGGGGGQPRDRPPSRGRRKRRAQVAAPSGLESRRVRADGYGLGAHLSKPVRSRRPGRCRSGVFRHRTRQSRSGPNAGMHGVAK